MWSVMVVCVWVIPPMNPKVQLPGMLRQTTLPAFGFPGLCLASEKNLFTLRFALSREKQAIAIDHI